MLYLGVTDSVVAVDSQATIQPHMHIAAASTSHQGRHYCNKSCLSNLISSIIIFHPDIGEIYVE